MAVQNREGPTLVIGQGFIAFEAIIDVPEALAQPVGLQPSMHPSQSVSAGWFFRQPGFEDRGVVELFPGVKTSQSRPEQNGGGLDHGGGGAPGSLAIIAEGGGKAGRKIKDLLGIRDQASENDLRTSFPTDASIPTRRLLR